MKLLIGVAVILLACPTEFFCQNPKDTAFVRKVNVFESEENMTKGTQNALIVTLEITDKKLAEKVWKNFMKSYGGKTKTVKGGKENLTTEAEVVGINGVNPLQIYSLVSSNPEGYAEMIVWFDLGEEFLSSRRRTQYYEAEKILRKYAHECKKEQTQNELAEAEKKLKSLENELDKLKRQNDSYHKEITDAERRIELAKANILKNEEQQTDTTEKIQLQKELIEEIRRRFSQMLKN